jgi:hypothetical protein
MGFIGHPGDQFPGDRDNEDTTPTGGVIFPDGEDWEPELESLRQQLRGAVEIRDLYEETLKVIATYESHADPMAQRLGTMALAALKAARGAVDRCSSRC